MNLEELQTKIEILETQQAFQEDTIESLNSVIIQQQKDIEKLDLKIDILDERIKQSATAHSETAGEEPPPPHY